jgi:hypothetical protein
MAALIKRLLKSKKTERSFQTGWASREERQQFERTRELWKNNATRGLYL